MAANHAVGTPSHGNEPERRSFALHFAPWSYADRRFIFTPPCRGCEGEKYGTQARRTAGIPVSDGQPGHRGRRFSVRNRRRRLGRTEGMPRRFILQTVAQTGLPTETLLRRNHCSGWQARFDRPLSVKPSFTLKRHGKRGVSNAPYDGRVRNSHFPNDRTREHHREASVACATETGCSRKRLKDFIPTSTKAPQIAVVVCHRRSFSQNLPPSRRQPIPSNSMLQCSNDHRPFW